MFDYDLSCIASSVTTLCLMQYKHVPSFHPLLNRPPMMWVGVMKRTNALTGDWLAVPFESVFGYGLVVHGRSGL